MLSNQRMECLQVGQFEAGKTMDSPRGMREMQTLRKLPRSRPRRNPRNWAKWRDMGEV